MYPIGEEIAKAHKAKPERPYWEHGWDSSKEDVWPKLFHYRASSVMLKRVQNTQDRNASSNRLLTDFTCTFRPIRIYMF